MTPFHRLALLAALVLAACGRYPIPTRPAPKVSSAPYKYILPWIGCHPCTPKPTPAPTPLPPIRISDGAYGVVDLDNNCDTLALIVPKWTYNYSTNPNACPGVESVPMIQSGAQISNTIAGNSEWILGFNEPEMPGWAHQTADEGAQNWRLIEQRYPDKLLISPSVISAGSYDALNWLHDFRAAYRAHYGENPRLDALGVHIYFEYAANAEPVISQAIALAAEWGAQGIVISEMGMARGDPTGSEEQTFMDWLQTQPVLRYSWFGSSIDVENGIKQGWYGSDWKDMSLVKGGALTDFGKVYVNYSGGRK